VKALGAARRKNDDDDDDDDVGMIEESLWHVAC
jgi:hypothetical protein